MTTIPFVIDNQQHKMAALHPSGGNSVLARPTIPIGARERSLGDCVQ